MVELIEFIIPILFIVETMFEEAPSSTLRDPRAPVALRDHIWNDITGSLDYIYGNVYNAFECNILTLCVCTW